MGNLQITTTQCVDLEHTLGSIGDRIPVFLIVGLILLLSGVLVDTVFKDYSYSIQI